MFSEFADDFAGEVCDGSLHESEPGLGRGCVCMSHDYCVLSIRGVQLHLPETQQERKRIQFSFRFNRNPEFTGQAKGLLKE